MIIDEEVLNMEARFSDRDSFPALLLVTPFDKSGESWTAEEPSVAILRRLSKLATASLQVVDSSLLDVDSHLGLKVRLSMTCLEYFLCSALIHNGHSRCTYSKFFALR